MHINPKVVAVAVLVAIVLAVAGVLLAPRYIENKINNKIEAVNAETGITVACDTIDVSGFLHIRLKGLTAQLDSGQSIAKIKFVDVTVNPIRYLLGGEALGMLQIDSADVSFWDGMLEGRENYDTVQAESEDDVAGIQRLIQKTLQLIPQHLSINTLTLRYGKGRNKNIFIVRSALKEGAEVAANLFMGVGRDTSSMLISGTFDGESWNMLFRSASRKTVHIPYAKNFSSSYVGFDSVRVSGSFTDQGSLRAVHNFWAYNSAVSHFRLSNSTVHVPYFAGSIDAGFTSDEFEIFDSSYVQINELKVYMTMDFEYRSPKHLQLSINTRQCSAQSFLESLPPGMFSCLTGMKIKGDIAISLNADIDYDDLDDLQFNVDVLSSGIKIQRYGQCNLGLMSGDFSYSVYEDGRFVRSIPITSSNPNFVPYDEISPYLRESVQIAEDGQFFAHRGFIAESFRHALVQNLKAGRFVRGGSTISQQLVKNVFLSRSKTIFRKLEEAAIVWLIEEQHLTPKKRMFEVYLNVIEWAPGVYGIAEAADFYFGKRASELTLAESIYLTSLVPKPKKFVYSFGKDGLLRSHYGRYYQFLSRNLLATGRIQPADTVGLVPIRRLTGRAAQYIVSDTIQIADSILEQDLWIDSTSVITTTNEQ